MIRLLLIVFLFSAAVPTEAWATGSWTNIAIAPNQGIQWIGPSCCDSGDPGVPVEQGLDAACCCRPTPSMAGHEIYGAIPVPNRAVVGILISYQAPQYIPASKSRIVRPAPGARGPPRDSLVNQHVLLIL
ncbi:MAG: hypothetical protein JKY56_08230 [Kofleriaceae bacterium]|nr:hypothetical protein [Kofleriaceae bacterium]